MKIYRLSQKQDYFTKDGRKITFQPHAFDENHDDRGFVVHNVNAYVDGEEAGYIKLSYIPREYWNRIYGGNVWKFRKLMNGSYDIPDDLIEQNDDELINQYMNDHYSGRQNFVKSHKSDFVRSYQTYEHYYVDKPIVDFIYINKEFRGQQIALQLHFYAKEWLKENFGLRLYLSSLLTRGEQGGKAFYGKVRPSLNLKTQRKKKNVQHPMNINREYMG